VLALLAQPDASALPGDLAANTRGGWHKVSLAALFLTGLRAAGEPIAPNAISAAATGGGNSDSDDGDGGGGGGGGGGRRQAAGSPARRRARPVAARTVAAFGEFLRAYCGVEIDRVVRPRAQLPVLGLRVPASFNSVAAWLAQLRWENADGTPYGAPTTGC